MTAKTLIILYYLCISASGIIASQMLTNSLVLAQISSDGTLRESTQVQTSAPNNQVIITGGTQEGSNLFHSFRELSVPSNIKAYFDNSSTINNIISRVTGSSISNIEGIIQSNGIANFILINPNGITFGPNAQINIGGSFLASTAESLTFADGVQFSATNPQASPLLTMSVPVGLQLGTNPGTIVNQARQLGVKPGNTFALVGGNIDFSGGTIQLEQGRIDIGSVGSNSQVQLTVSNSGFQLGYQGVENFQDIALSHVSTIEGNNSVINLQGRHISVTEQSQIRNTTTDLELSGDLTVNASESIKVIDSTAPTARASGLFATDVQGNATSGTLTGNIIIKTKYLLVQDGGIITADAQGVGTGGTVKVNASEFIQLIGTSFFNPSLISANTGAIGNGGEVDINTGKLIIQDGAQIQAATALMGGDGGNITINATESIQVSGRGIINFPGSKIIVPSRITAETGFQELRLAGFAPGGNVNINTNQLSITNGGIISVSSLGLGNAGNLNIKANFIFLDHQGVLTASSEGTGDAGNLTIETNYLTLNNQSEVAVRSIGFGQGGSLNIKAGSIALDNNSQLAATSAALDPETAQTLGIDPDFLALNEFSANAGSLNIVTDNLILNNQSEITVSSFGLGDAGDINIEAQNILLDNDSRLSAETASGEGGNITLDFNNLLILRHNSQISTTAGTQGGTGNGGNIDIKAKFIIAVPSENSDIFANAFLGQGGNISITTSGVYGIEERVILTPLSDITASSQFGQVGTVAINRPDVDPQRSLVKLPGDVVDAKNLIVDACSPGGAFSRGEFTITGRGGVSPNPREGVNTQTGLTELGYPNTNLSNLESSSEGNDHTSSSNLRLNQRETHGPPIVEAQGWITDADGKVVLTAQASAVTPHSSGFMPATCYDLSTTNQSPSP